MKEFVIKSISSIPYLKNIGDDAVHDIIYNLKGTQFNKGEILQEPGDNATSLYFL